MFGVVFQSLSFVTGVVIPLQLTLETLHMSRDSTDMVSILKTSMFLKENHMMNALLLKYWALYVTLFIAIPMTPLLLIYEAIPLAPVLLILVSIVLTRELLTQFVKFVNEQKKFTTNFLQFLDNIKDSKRSKFEEFAKLYQNGIINYYNMKYNLDLMDKNISDNFLFGQYTDAVISLTKRYASVRPNTEYIQFTFDVVIHYIVVIRDEIRNSVRMWREQRQREEEEAGDSEKDTKTRGFTTSFWSPPNPTNANTTTTASGSDTPLGSEFDDILEEFSSFPQQAPLD